VKRILAATVWFAGGLASVNAADLQDHWAFQPVRRIEPPAVRNAAWVQTPIDRFILSSLETNKLEPSPPASREQFIRRVTLGLIGLPPTPEEIDAFVNDTSPDARAKLIDGLLASPRYGERWARHWLDLARYAESDGFEHDAARPHSWRYRDYVIKSFNDDKPFDRFVREQIAGDALWPDSPEALTATAFHLLGPDMVDSADQVQRRFNTLNDMTDTTASVFLGLTLGCARCHNHKHEPLTQSDYYSMQAFFAPALFERERLIPTAAERAAYETETARYRSLTASQQKQIDELEAPFRERLHAEKLAVLSEDAQLAHQTPKDKRTVEQENTVQETAGMLKISEAELVKTMSGEQKSRRKRLIEELKRIPKPLPLPTTMSLADTNGAPPKVFILHRGDYSQPGEEVQAGFPAILCGGRREATHSSKAEIRNPKSEMGASRTALADWLVSPDNPLTARVMVNRLWQHHFGRGLVATPSDFGTRGARPTHPELLDWLAAELMEPVEALKRSSVEPATGSAAGKPSTASTLQPLYASTKVPPWSLKHIHRLILNSAAYQQSSQASREALARDPENKLFSRQNRVRLEGEAIRDSLLAISGRLNPAMYGPSVSPPVPADITKTSKNWTASADPADHTRRSVYIFARRNLRFPFLEAFDAPDNNLTCPERGRSTTAPQSLTLLNSEEVMTAARATAERVARITTKPDGQIESAFRLAIGRPPTAQELAMSKSFVAKASSNAGDLAGLTELCRALFNLNAFVYVD
jgi:hypothetical protein